MERKNARCVSAKKEMDSLMDYRQALQNEDKAVFDRLLGYAKEHTPACANARAMKLSESMLLAMVLEQQKKLDLLDTLAAERGDPKSRRPSAPEEVRSRPQDVDLFMLLNRTEVKEYPPWVVA